ncbi:phenol hydroxylase subunit P4 [Neptuniibacter sp. CAU 1671]|uniref:phenol hydroxylase subunit P4 n=1 Tax=Neptuniibacter sp. CAU 1671 TaxID=3032593 RepID=UPI0023DB42EF|nr:phenol hydroxylase subunit P4 [Neptuniibacter sp. CAU 1671]MDF2180545.1 phenol hydroxylase subunit P4 [Neptuniibacter sp. CAU 1671]
MPVYALKPDYTGEIKDRVENFHGNQLVYIGWDHHLLFSSPFSLLAPIGMRFDVFFKEIVSNAFSQHPEWDQIDWSSVTWLLDGQPFIPQPEVSLGDQGINHKSFLRFQTPGLTGIAGAGI